MDIDRLLAQVAGAATSAVLASRASRNSDTSSFDPVKWVQNSLAFEPWEKQKDILWLPFRHRRAAVRSGHGVGKTRISAATALAFFKAHPDSIVITTAPTERQVKDQLWGYIRDDWKKSGIGGKMLTTKLTIGDRHYMAGYTARNAESFQGIHAPHLLVIVDEASGIEPHIERAIEGLMSSGDAHLLLIGNPTRRSGLFYEAFHEKKHLYEPMHISCWDSPGVTDPSNWPNLTGMEYIQEKLSELGEDSPLYQIQVLGNFPSAEAEGIIPITWVETCSNLKFDDEGPFVAGFDVARYGGDENVIFLRRGRQIVGFWQWFGVDTMESVGKAEKYLNEALREIAINDGMAKPYVLENLYIDAIGIGAGVADRMREIGWPVEDFIAGATPDKSDMLNLRAQAWWELRDQFREQQIGGVKDTKTQSQLTSVLYRMRSDRRVQVESKEDMKKRGVKSPDRADALVMCFQQPRMRPNVCFV